MRCPCDCRGPRGNCGPPKAPRNLLCKRVTHTNSSQHAYLREFVNSRHPDPRRVWKVGPGAHLLPPLPADCRDNRDNRDCRNCAETSIFDNPSIDFEQQLGKHFPTKTPKAQKVASRVGQTLGRERRIILESRPTNLFRPRPLLLATLPSLSPT